MRVNHGEQELPSIFWNNTEAGFVNDKTHQITWSQYKTFLTFRFPL